MNKIFKIIWNHSTQTFTVVSELARSCGKSGSLTDKRKSSKVAVVLGTVLGASVVIDSSFFVSPVYAAEPTAGQPISGRQFVRSYTQDGNIGPTNALHIGPNSNISNGSGQGERIYVNATAVGANSVARQWSTALGSSAKSTGGFSTAIGYNANTASHYATAVGQSSSVSGDGGAAFGSNATAVGETATAIGFKANADGANSTALGSYSRTSGEKGSALGYNASAGERATAVGQSSNAAGVASFAGGADAKSGGKESVAVGQSANSSGASSVSVGHSSSSAGTNAVAIGKSSSANQNHAVAIGDGAKTSGQKASALGFGAKAAERATAVGQYSNASGVASFAGGADATSSGTESVAIGQTATSSGAQSIAIGKNARATHDNSIALGNGSTTATGVNTSSAKINDLTYKGFQGATAHGVVSIGSAGKERQLKNVAAGQITAGSTDAINGSQLYQVIRQAHWKVRAENTTGGTASGKKDQVVHFGDTVKFIAGNGLNIAQNNHNFTISVNTAALTPNNSGAINTPSNNDAGKLVNASTVANAINKSGHKVATASDNNQVTSKTNTAGELIKAGETVTYKAGKNLEVNQTGKTIAFGLSKDIDVNSTTTKTLTVPAGNNNNIVINKDGINAGGKKITNVANGANNNDAVNISQLKANTTHVVKGSNIVEVSKTTGTNGITYTVHAKGAEVASDNNFLTVTKSAAANNVTLHTLGLKTSNIPTTTTSGIIGRPAADGLVTANNVVDAINNVSWRVTSGKTTGENPRNSTELVKAGDLVEFFAGDNVKIEQAGKRFTISAKQPNASTTDLTVDGNGNVTAPADGSKLVNATTVIKAINDSGYKVASKDTEEQLASSTANDTGVLVTPGDKQTFTAAKNLEVKQEGANITFGLSKDITVNSTTTNSLSVPTGGVVINATGINAGNKKITNVADGVNDNDAVNISQLKANTTKVIKGSNIADVTKTSSDDGITYTVHANGSAVAAKDNLVTVTSNTGTNNVTTYTVGVTTGTIADAGNDGKLTNPTSNGLATVTNIVTAVNSVSWALQEKGNTKNSVRAGDKVDFVDGLGTTISVTGDEDKSTVKYDIKLADSSLKVDNNGLSANTTTLTPKAEGNITVPTGAEAGKLVNATTVANAINESGHKVATADDDEQVTSGANANGELIKAGEKVIYKAGKNLAVKQDGKTIAFGLTENITVNTVNATTINVPTGGNNKVIINNEGINAGNKKITNVENGAADKDAVNISQLKANTTIVAKGSNIVDVTKTNNADGITYTVHAKGANVTSTSPLLTVAQSNAANNVTLHTLSLKTSDISTTPTVTGTITRPADNAVATVQNVVDVVNNVSWRIVSGATAQGQNTGSNTELVKAGDLVEFIAGENVKIDQAGKKFTISAKQPNASTTDLTVDNNGNVTTNPTDGSKLVNATTVIKAINDSGYKVASKDTDEELASSTVNEDGVLLTTGDKQTFTAGKNLEVKQDGANITFALSKDIIVNSTTTNSLSVPTGGVVINADGINAGNKKISNVANGTDNNDAVNISQLKANTTKVVKGTNVAGVEKIEETADGITYQINADGTNVTAAQGSFVTVNKGTKDATTNVTTYTVDITKGEVEANTATGAVTLKNGTTDGVATAQNVANAIAGSGWKLTGPENKETVVNPGDSVNFIDGTGTKVVIDTTNQNAPTVKVDIQTATVETDPNNEGKVSVKTGDKGENLVNATTVAEAINSVGHKVATATDNSQVTSSVNAAGELIKAGETVTYKAGKNLEVNQTGKTIAFGLSENIDVGTVNATTINVPTGGTNKVTINADGISAGNKAISNVADGVNDNDAVNISQLKANTTKVEAGSNIAAVSKTNDANGITYTVHANGSKVAAKDGLVTVEEGQKDANNVTTYTVGVTTGTIADATDGKLTNPNANTDALATVNNVVSAVNSVSWELQGKDGKVDDVKAGDKVKLIAGDSGLTTVTITPDTATNTNTITVDVNKGNFGTLPTVANPSATNTGALLAVGNGNVNSQDGVASVTDVISAVNAAFWRVKSSQDGGENTTGSEQAVKAGELVEFAAGDNVKIVQAGKKFTISAKQADTSTADVTITNGKADEPSSDNGGKLVNVTTVVKALNNVSHKVATDSDDVQVTDKTDTTGVDIKAGDKLIYKAGKNLAVKQDGKTIAFGLTENITVNTVNATTINVPTGGTNKVVIDGNGISAGNKAITNVADGVNNHDAVNISQLKANTTTVVKGTNVAGVEKISETVDGITYQINADGTNVTAAQGSFVTVTPGTKDTATNVTTYTVGITKGEVEANTATGAVSLKNGTTDGVATAQNVANAIASSGWKLNGNDGTKNVSTIVNPGDNVTFEGEGTAKVTTEVSADGNSSTIKVSVDGKAITDAAKGSITVEGNKAKTDDADDDKLATTTDVVNAINESGHKVATADTDEAFDDSTLNKDGVLVKPGDKQTFTAGKNLEVKQDGANMTFALSKNINVNSVTVETADKDDANKKGAPITMVSIPGLKNTLSFIAPEKDENGKIVGTAPVTIKNINGNLEPTYNTGDIHIIGGRPSDRDVNKPTIEQNAPSKDTIASMYNNAATVGDVLNAGWNLRGNGKPVDFVKPYDSVNFVDGEGTTAVVESVDGKANNVTFNVDKGEVTATDQGNVTGPVSKELIDKLEAAQKAKEQLPDTATKEQKEAADKAVKDAQNAVDKATNQVATAKNVADAINNSGHKVATKDTDEELATSTVNDAGTLVKPGTKQIFTAGKNLEVKQDGANITFALSKDISVNSTTTNTLTVPVDGGNITINKDGINAGDKNISNVADGTEDHHAVNVKQLKAAKSSVEKGTNIAGIETKINADGSTTYVVHADGTKVEAAAGSLVTVTAGAKDATTNVTTYTVDLKKGHLTVDEDTGVADSTDATDKVATTKQVADAINASGWKLSGKDIDDKAITTIVNPGEQVTFEGEDAAKVITTVDNKTGNTTIKVKVDGKAITDAAKGDITVTDGVANTTDAKDDKLATTTDVVNAINNSGHKVATNDTNDAIETSETNATGVLVKPGDKQTFTAGKNLKVKQEGANIAFALANDIEVNKVTTTELKAGPVTINNNGIDAGDKNISNVADGTEDHHAVNVKQLKAAKSSVEKGTNIAGIETKTNTDGSTTYVVHADGTKVEAAVGSLVTVKAGVKDPTTNVTTYTIDLQKGNLTADKTTGKVTSTDTAEDKAATTKQVADAIANSGWKLAGKDENGADVSTIVNPGESVAFEGEGAAKVITKVDADGNTTIKVKVDGKAITDSAKGDITVTDGVANTTDAEDDKLATTTDVVNAINNSGHKVATNDTNDAIETSETNATGVLVKPGDKQTFTAGKNLKVKQDGANVTFAVSNDLDVDSVKVGEPGKDGKPGKDGTVAVNGKDGSSVVINGKDGSIGLTGPKGKDGKDGVSANIKIGVGEPGVDGKDGVPGLEGADGKPQKPRMEYTYDNNGTKVTEKVATLKDGLIFDGDVGEEVKRPLNSKLTVKGGQKDRKKLADKANVGVVSDPETNSLEVKLAKEIDLTNEGSVTIGDTVVNDNGVTIKNGPSIHKSGINAGNRTINNVKEGVKGTDAVNVNQLNRKVGDVHNRINKVNKDLQAGVAGATAMAFLQRPNLPGKSMVSAAVGGYKGQSAVAVGYARNSDNNKVSIKLGVGLNTRKDVTYGGSVGYQW